MIRDYIRLRRLKRQRKKFEVENRVLIDEVEFFDLWNVDLVGKGKRELVADTYWDYNREIRVIETKFLRRLAKKYDIELKPDYLGMAYNKNGQQIPCFSDAAMVAIKNAIRQRKKENRESIEWWVTKVVVPVLGALTGLIGVLLAIYALKK